jgi:hypothetical protein
VYRFQKCNREQQKNKNIARGGRSPAASCSIYQQGAAEKIKRENDVHLVQSAPARKKSTHVPLFSSLVRFSARGVRKHVKKIEHVSIFFHRGRFSGRFF